MKRVVALALSLMLSVAVVGCAGKTHFNNVPEDQQNSERFISNTKIALEAIEDAQKDFLKTSVELFDNGKLTVTQLQTIRTASKYVDKAFNVAGEALKEYRKETTAGNSPTTAGVDAAIEAVKQALKELQGVI